MTQLHLFSCFHPPFSYCFRCGCVACAPSSKQRHAADLLLQHTKSLKCQACEGPLLPASRAKSQCEFCPEKFVYRDLENKALEAKNLYQQAQINPKQRRALLEKSLTVGKSIFFEMNELLIEIRDKLAHELARNDEFEVAAEYKMFRKKNRS